MAAKVRDVCVVNWTAAEDARLRFLWAEGFSASEIGKELGRTRNSVIGRKTRLKIDQRSIKEIRERAATGARHARARRMKRNEPPKIKRHPTRPVLDGHAIPTIAVDVSALKGRAWEPLPGSQPKPLHELGTRDCRWSVSDSVHIFCAEQATRDYGYCLTHSAMAFRPLVKL